MGSVWRDFEVPKKLVCEDNTLTDSYGKFIAEPFERGFGMTVGNGLRRVLISSLEGAAVTSIKLDGALHEFTTLPGMLEDVTQLALNVKQLVLRSHSRQPKTVVLEKDKKGPVTAGDITTDETVEVLNPDLVLCTLTKAIPFRMELTVERGRAICLRRNRARKGKPSA